MFLGKVLNLAFYSIVIAVIFELIFSKIRTNKIDKVSYNYPALSENKFSHDSNGSQKEAKNFSLDMPEQILIRIGILSNPEPINEEFHPNKTNVKNSQKRKGVFNSTYVNWLNNTINSDFIIEEIENYFNVGRDGRRLKIKLEFVPLLFWQNDSVIDDIFSKINGVLFIGGNRDVDFRYEWENYAIKIMKKILHLQENNRKIPLWGICQGIEIIHAILVNTTQILEKFSSWNQMQNIEIREFEEISNKKRSIYYYLNNKEKEFLIKEKSTVHYHNLGLNPDTFKNQDYSILKQMFQISAFGYDSNGKKFINSVESYEPYNIFAVQFHPEKNPIKKMRNLRESNELFMKNFNRINSKITINYFIKAIEDFLITNNKNNELESAKETSKPSNFFENFQITNFNILHNFQGSPLPIYLFSE